MIYITPLSSCFLLGFYIIVRTRYAGFTNTAEKTIFIYNLITVETEGSMITCCLSYYTNIINNIFCKTWTNKPEST